MLRILETFEFTGVPLEDAGIVPTPSTVPEPVPPSTPELPEATGNQPLKYLDQIGAPTARATVAYEHSAPISESRYYAVDPEDMDAVVEWANALPGRIGCTNPVFEVEPTVEAPRMTFRCDVVRDDRVLMVRVGGWFGQFGTEVSVMVTG